MKSVIKVGTRGSKLALYQAELLRSGLKELFPLIEFELVKIHTRGDMIRRGTIRSIGPAIFTREIEEALLANQVDMGVHSAKDLATELPEGLEIGAFLMREDARDCLVARGGMDLKELPQGARIGTGSIRRRAQLKKLRPDLQIVDLRGNVETRLRKTLEEGEYDGMVLAHAGLLRLSLQNHVTQVFDEDAFLPQAGQGAVAVEIRQNDVETKKMLHSVNHEITMAGVTAERSFLRCLEGGCQIPAGVRSRIDGNILNLKGAVFSLDGDREISDSINGPVSDGQKLGWMLGEKILEAGGRELLQAVRKAVEDRD